MQGRVRPLVSGEPAQIHTEDAANSCEKNLPGYKPISLNETTQKELYFFINLFIGFLRGSQMGVIRQVK